MAWVRRPIRTRTSDQQRFLTSEGHRSGLEDKNAAHLKANGIEPAYEAYTLRYEKPSRMARYTPDFPLLHNGIIVETKGRFVTADRQKHLHVKAAHPLLDIRFVFSNPNARIGKKSSTTYAMWCDKHGFKYAAKLIPVAWINEPAEATRIAAMKSAFAQ